MTPDQPRNPIGYVPQTAEQLKVLLPDFVLARQWMGERFLAQDRHKLSRQRIIGTGFLNMGPRRCPTADEIDELLEARIAGESGTRRLKNLTYGKDWQEDAEYMLEAIQFLDDDTVINVDAKTLHVWIRWTELWRAR